MSKRKTLFIDVDAAVKTYNKFNPDQPKMTRTRLAEMLGMSYQSLTNYQGGKIPEMIGTLDQIVEITGVKYEALIKEKKDEL